MNQATETQQDLNFIYSSIKSLTDESLTLLVSEWAEQKRVLPKELTSRPGAWDNDYTKYLVKIMDCLSQRSPTRKVAVMKGAQVGASTGILENWIGYTIEHDPCGMLFVTGDAELAKTSVEVKIDKMISNCGLENRIKNPDPKSNNPAPGRDNLWAMPSLSFFLSSFASSSTALLGN